MGPARLPALASAALVLWLAAWPGKVAAEVSFQGLTRTTETAVRGRLRLASERCDAPEARVRRLFRAADAEIRTALEVYGYFTPTIQKELEFTARCWQARFTIDRGSRVVLRTVNVGVSGPGGSDRTLAEAARRHPFQAGAGLNQRTYEDYKGSLSALARQRGYFEADYATSRVDVYPEQQAADVTLDFATGPRYRFGPVVFEQDVVREELAARFLDFAPGEPYHADRISDLYSALLVSGYFEGVDIRTTPRPAPDQDVLVTIGLTPAASRTWTTGIGYSTDTGPQLRLGFIDRRRNRQGHQFEVSGSFSPVIGEATASYRLPRGSPRDEWRSFSIGYRYEEPDTSDSRQFKAGVKDLRRRRGGWLESRFIDYSRESFTLGEQRDTTDLIVPGISWANQTRQISVRPTAAFRVSLQVTGTTEVIGSDADFLQFEAFGRLIRPLWSGARVLTRLEAGTTFRDEFTDLPFSVRYFAGGDYSVRGYDYKTLGPTDDNGVVIGGSEKLVGSVELDQRVATNWSAAAFVDAGNAFNTWGNMRLKTGVGAGIRWYSPLGPIRFDLAFPLASDAPDSWRIHITLGPDL